MPTTLSLDERIRGALVGAAIGAELGFVQYVEPKRYDRVPARRLFAQKLAPVRTYRPERGRVNLASTTPLIGLGVRAYLKCGGRVTPEQFGALFRDDPGVATPAFVWDGLHTVQELLREGMNPRISGLGTYPNGLICAAMPAVGIYHFAHPDYAYLDGVELASVAQGRQGADWAGLCAAAVAAALEPGRDGEGVVDTVMRLAFQNNREVFYELNAALRRAAQPTEAAFLEYWAVRGGAMDLSGKTGWVAYNPLLHVLPVVKRYAAEPRKLMALLTVPPVPWCTPSVSAAIGGAVAGALHGPAGFPRAWRHWGEPLAKPWFPLAEVVRRRVRQEAQIIAVTERLAAPQPSGPPLLKEKVRGCILAGAIGNAMGSPVEGRMYREIDREHPKGITTVLDPRRLEGEDDNQMAMRLVETYLAREGQPVMARHFGRTWQERLNRDHFFPLCMGNAYDLIGKGWDPRIIGHWSVVTGSTVMCMEPVGIFHMGDPAFAAIDAQAVSYMYQRGLDVVAATMLAATVAEAFRPEATVDSVCRAALAAAPTEPLRTFDRRPFKSCRDYVETCLEVADRHTDVLAARPALYRKCLLYHPIDPLELWGLALAMFKIARGDVRQAAIGGTNIGRDSDTIAGRAAMLAGILRGASNVPPEWVRLFKPESLEKIERNADRLADLVAGRKLHLLRARQAAARAGT
jgi:ADP-ribosylglycohydrolase